MNEKIRQKLIDLETALGLLQHDYEQQNEMILANSRRLDKIEKLLRNMHLQIESLQIPHEPRTLEDDKPPHY